MNSCNCSTATQPSPAAGPKQPKTCTAQNLALRTCTPVHPKTALAVHSSHAPNNHDIHAQHSNCAHLPAGLQSQQAPTVRSCTTATRTNNTPCSTATLCLSTQRTNFLVPDDATASTVCHGNGNSLALLAHTNSARHETGIRNRSHPPMLTTKTSTNQHSQSKSAVQNCSLSLPLPFLQQSLQLERRVHVQTTLDSRPQAELYSCTVCANCSCISVTKPAPTNTTPTTELAPLLVYSHRCCQTLWDCSNAGASRQQSKEEFR
jgi:hypothetical protein